MQFNGRILSKSLIGAFLCFIQPVFAQDGAILEDKKIDEISLDDLMNNTVTSASKLKQKASEAPSIIAVINRDQLYDYGWFSLNDAMTHQAGFFPSKDYDRTAIGSRGLFEGWNNNHILHLVDGVPFNDPMYGSAYTWENSPIFMIKSVEVIRGPGSALYGSNATNGVIAVKTMSGEDMKGKAEARVRLGTADSSWMEVYTGNTAGNFSYFTGFSSFYSNGNEYLSADGSGRVDGSGNPAKFMINDDRSSHYFIFKAEGRGDMKDWSVQYHDQAFRFQTGHGWLWSIPDVQDAMYEHRRLLTLSYSPSLGSNTTSEFTLKYERKEIDWFTRYAPTGAAGYTAGISEYVNFFHDNLFGRAQITQDMGNSASWLLGLETNMFMYNGDKSHYSNTNLADGSFTETTDGVWAGAPPILGLIEDRPVLNVGLYTQLVTGNWISSALPITFGLRYDRQMVKYDSKYVGGDGTKERNFDQLSPRLGVVYLASDRMSFKFLAGRAFRAPAPSELAGTGTWALANNIENLNPETVTTFEVGSDWRVTDQLSWKINAYHTRFEDQIGYSVSNANLSTNIYTTTTAGAETEVTYNSGPLKTFGNFSYSQRLAEEINDATVSEHDSEVTWAPSMTANLGTTYSYSDKLKGTLVAQYMGEVKRRDKDRATAINDEMRGGSVDAWFALDASAQYDWNVNSTFRFYVKNLLDQDRSLIKNRDYPFDYQMEGRSFYGSLSYRF